MPEEQSDKLKELKMGMNVVQSNMLARFPNNFTLTQAKIFSFLISCIDSQRDKELPILFIDYRTMLKILRLNGSMHSKEIIEDCLTSLMSKYYYEHTKGAIIAISFFDTIAVNYNNEDNMVLVKFNDTLTDYLINLKSNFVSYKLPLILDFSSAYSIKFYEICSSYAHKQVFEYTVEQLREMLNLKNKKEKINKFPEFNDFKRRVLEPSIAEINLNTDLTVSYEKVKDEKDKRKIKAIRFHVEKQENFEAPNKMQKFMLCDQVVDGAKYRMISTQDPQ